LIRPAKTLRSQRSIKTQLWFDGLKRDVDQTSNSMFQIRRASLAARPGKETVNLAHFPLLNIFIGAFQ